MYIPVKNLPCTFAEYYTKHIFMFLRNASRQCYINAVPVSIQRQFVGFLFKRLIAEGTQE